MKKFIIIALISIFSICAVSFSKPAKNTKKSSIVKTTKLKAPKAKRGVISKVGSAATYGFGWQLGKEAAKETIKGAKKLYNKAKEKKSN